MRILVLCPHLRPDVAPTGEVMTRIVEELAARGHELDVVTSLAAEIRIIFAICYVTFPFFGLRYNAVLSLLIGLSVLIPWVGAVIVTFPLMLVAYFQWGFGTEWLWIMGAYFIIQGFDANILVPLLYSEVVDLHPIAIIAAVLFFGGVWGLWGVFFSIPLATLVQAVIKAWPSPELPVVTASIPDQR